MRKYRLKYDAHNKETLLYSVSADGIQEEQVGESSPLCAGLWGAMSEWLSRRGAWPGFFQALLENAGDVDFCIEFTGSSDDYSYFLQAAEDAEKKLGIHLDIYSTENNKAEKFMTDISRIIKHFSETSTKFPAKLSKQWLDGLRKLLDSDITYLNAVNALKKLRNDSTNSREYKTLEETVAHLGKKIDTYSQTLRHAGRVYIFVEKHLNHYLNEFEELKKSEFVPSIRNNVIDTENYDLQSYEVPVVTLTNNSGTGIPLDFFDSFKRKLISQLNRKYSGEANRIVNGYISKFEGTGYPLVSYINQADSELNAFKQKVPSHINFTYTGLQKLDLPKNCIDDAIAKLKFTLDSFKYTDALFDLSEYTVTDQYETVYIHAERIIDNQRRCAAEAFVDWVWQEKSFVRGFIEKIQRCILPLKDELNNALRKTQEPYEWFNRTIKGLQIELGTITENAEEFSVWQDLLLREIDLLLTEC